MSDMAIQNELADRVLRTVT